MSRTDEDWKNAEASRAQGNWAEADAGFRRALDAEEQSAQFHLAYGTFLAERQEFRRAMIHLLHAKDAATAAGDSEAQSTALANLAAVFRQIGEFDQARRFQRQVLSLKAEANADDLLAWSADALLANNLSLAESLAETAFGLADDADDDGTAADCLGVLGLIAARGGHLRRAVALLIQAARQHRDLDDPQGWGTDCANLSEVCGQLGRQRWQVAFLETASRCFEQMGMPQSQQLMSQRLRVAVILQQLSAGDPDWN